MKATAILKDNIIQILVGNKVIKEYPLHQKDKAASYIHGWNQLEKKKG